jgi:hypothetical protein
LISQWKDQLGQGHRGRRAQGIVGQEVEGRQEEEEEGWGCSYDRPVDEGRENDDEEECWGGRGVKVDETYIDHHVGFSKKNEQWNWARDCGLRVLRAFSRLGGISPFVHREEMSNLPCKSVTSRG